MPGRIQDSSGSVSRREAPTIRERRIEAKALEPQRRLGASWEVDHSRCENAVSRSSWLDARDPWALDCAR